MGNNKLLLPIQTVVTAFWYALHKKISAPYNPLKYPTAREMVWIPRLDTTIYLLPCSINGHDWGKK